MTQEQRQHPRFNIQCSFNVWERGQSVSALTENISLDGALFKTDAVLKIGSRLTLVLETEHGTGATLADVLRQEGTGCYAVQFTKPTDEFLSVLFDTIFPYMVQHTQAQDAVITA